MLRMELANTRCHLSWAGQLSSLQICQRALATRRISEQRRHEALKYLQISLLLMHACPVEPESSLGHVWKVCQARCPRNRSCACRHTFRCRTAAKTFPVPCAWGMSAIAPERRQCLLKWHLSLQCMDRALHTCVGCPAKTLQRWSLEGRPLRLWCALRLNKQLTQIGELSIA